MCVGPTRELVRQIMAVVNAMGKFIGVDTFLAIPGNDLARGETLKAQVIVGTPARSRV